MTAMRFLTDLRERSVNLWLRLSTRSRILEMVEILDGHETETADLLGALPAAAELRHNVLAKKPRNSVAEELIAFSSVLNARQEEQNPYVRYVYKGLLAQRLALDKKFVRAEGCYLFDTEGARYADFAGAVPFGYDPEPLWQSLQAARRERALLASPSILASELAERLLALAPVGLGHVVFTNSGAEAVESAVALARCRTGRLGILSADGGFNNHIASTRGYGAPVPGFEYVAFGDLDALEAALAARPSFFAALLVETIQVESGINVAPAGYLAAALKLCHRFGALLIVDEVRIALGRTGTLFACEAEGITPDILALGNALGGELISIGACLYSPAVYTEHFDLRQEAAFAPNALAFRAMLATINELSRDDQRLVHQAGTVGHRIRQQLEELRSEFPMLVAAIRGRGLMLGMELNLDHIVKTQTGILAIYQDQGILLHVMLSYLLNAEHVHIMPSFRHGSVLRLEPPLAANAEFCYQMIDALRRLLDALQRGDAGELIAHFMEGARLAKALRPNRQKRHYVAQSPVSPRLARSENQCNRFAYVVHLLSMSDMRRFDPSLEPFSDAQVEQFRKRMASVTKPIPLDKIVVNRPGGRFAEGELILLPHLPSELLALSGKEAVNLVQSAADLGVARGARVVGLGGFSSIISYGGNALEQRPGVTVTSGNSLTTWAAMRSVEAACARRGLAMPECTVAIVGANGAIGHALSLLFAERAGELILLGNPRNPEASLRKLQRVAADCRRHVTSLAAGGRHFTPGTLAAEIVSRLGSGNAHDPELEARMTLTTEIDQQLPRAHVVLTATKAVLPFIAPRHLREGALVCDVSRPFNVAPEVPRRRPDLCLVSGGLIRIPGSSTLGYIEERDRPKVLMSCAAETILLALSGYQSSHLCGRLEIETIDDIGRQAESFGFSVVD
jgi:acetylornithine/succinyldiaminopimelate/putrescine aminotransferase/predicted amino acid dehydrogenase